MWAHMAKYKYVNRLLCDFVNIISFSYTHLLGSISQASITCMYITYIPNYTFVSNRYCARIEHTNSDVEMGNEICDSGYTVIYLYVH